MKRYVFVGRMTYTAVALLIIFFVFGITPVMATPFIAPNNIVAITLEEQLLPLTTYAAELDHFGLITGNARTSDFLGPVALTYIDNDPFLVPEISSLDEYDLTLPGRSRAGPYDIEVLAVVEETIFMPICTLHGGSYDGLHNSLIIVRQTIFGVGHYFGGTIRIGV